MGETFPYRNWEGLALPNRNKSCFLYDKSCHIKMEKTKRQRKSCTRILVEERERESNKKMIKNKSDFSARGCERRGGAENAPGDSVGDDVAGGWEPIDD